MQSIAVMPSLLWAGSTFPDPFLVDKAVEYILSQPDGKHVQGMIQNVLTRLSALNFCGFDGTGRG